MYKPLLIIVLAICLVSVHAFVKRDATAEASSTTENALEAILKTASTYFNQAKDKAGDFFDPEAIKKGFKDAFDNASKAFNNLKPKQAEGQ